MIDYRKEKVNIIKEMTFNLINILPMDITKIESIPFKDLQDMRKKVDEWLFLVNKPDRDVNQSHISPNDVDTMTEDKIKNSFHINTENFETRAKDFKKLKRGEL